MNKLKIDGHMLDNMIYNLELKKNLKKVEFTQAAVKEVLDYLHELKEKNEYSEKLEGMIQNFLMTGTNAQVCMNQCVRYFNELNKLIEKAANFVNYTQKFKTYQPIYYIDKYYDRIKDTDVYDIFDDHYYVAENENEVILGWDYQGDFSKRQYSHVRKDWVFDTEPEAQAFLEKLRSEGEK